MWGLLMMLIALFVYGQLSPTSVNAAEYERPELHLQLEKMPSTLSATKMRTGQYKITLANNFVRDDAGQLLFAGAQTTKALVVSNLSLLWRDGGCSSNSLGYQYPQIGQLLVKDDSDKTAYPLDPDFFLQKRGMRPYWEFGRAYTGCFVINPAQPGSVTRVIFGRFASGNTYRLAPVMSRVVIPGETPAQNLLQGLSMYPAMDPITQFVIVGAGENRVLLQRRISMDTTPAGIAISYFCPECASWILSGGHLNSLGYVELDIPVNLPVQSVLSADSVQVWIDAVPARKSGN